MVNRFRLLVTLVVFVAASTGYGYAFWFRHTGIDTLLALPGYIAGGVAETSIYRATYDPQHPISDFRLHQIGTWTCGLVTFVYFAGLALPFLLHAGGITQRWRKAQILVLVAAIPFTILCLFAFIAISFPRPT